MKVVFKLNCLWVFAVALAGCRSTAGPAPAVLSIPDVIACTTCFYGTALTGPVPAPEGSSLDTMALEATVSFLALAALPEEGFDPAAVHTQWVTAFRGGNPMLHLAAFTAGSRAGTIEAVPDFLDDLDQGRWGGSAPLVKMRAVLAAGKTTVFRLEETRDHGRPLTGDAPKRGAEIQIHYEVEKSRSLQIALAIDDWIEPGVAEKEEEPFSEGGAAASAPRDGKAHQTSYLQREVVLLDPETSNALWPVVLFFPSHFVTSPARAFVAVIELAPHLAEAEIDAGEAPSAPADERYEWPVIAQQLEERVMPDQRALTRIQYKTPCLEAAAWPGIEQVLEELSTTPQKRRALLFLATQAKAPLTIDATLVAPESLIFELADQVRNKTAAASELTLEVLGWILESSTLSLVAEQLAGQDLSWELEALLARHTGEVGRDAASLNEALLNVQGIEAFQARLVYENLLFLQDSSPAARCRAYDWLSEKGRAPEGYDPLDPLKKRRAALEGAVEELTDDGSGENAK
ncbi:MAG: hypothetical protein ABIK28_22790 [Planctomycetota bacterium]